VNSFFQVRCTQTKSTGTLSGRVHARRILLDALNSQLLGLCCHPSFASYHGGSAQLGCHSPCAAFHLDDGKHVANSILCVIQAHLWRDFKHASGPGHYKA